ncbi:ferritin-like domain-containing protein, partial [Escherichia coli]|uniref:ferritin-like domain-containing protein n=4 Tax=Pseudomonadota TaxID=1224 RepID=UPI0013D832AB
AIALLGGASGLARAASADPAKDSGILNVALGLEHEAINAYQLGATSGLLQKPVLDVAVRFQSHHKAHRDALIATIQALGGKPVA